MPKPQHWGVLATVNRMEDGEGGGWGQFREEDGWERENAAMGHLAGLIQTRRGACHTSREHRQDLTQPSTLRVLTDFPWSRLTDTHAAPCWATAQMFIEAADLR